MMNFELGILNWLIAETADGKAAAFVVVEAAANHVVVIVVNEAVVRI